MNCWCLSYSYQRFLEFCCTALCWFLEQKSSDLINTHDWLTKHKLGPYLISMSKHAGISMLWIISSDIHVWPFIYTAVLKYYLKRLRLCGSVGRFGLRLCLIDCDYPERGPALLLFSDSWWFQNLHTVLTQTTII